MVFYNASLPIIIVLALGISILTALLASRKAFQKIAELRANCERLPLEIMSWLAMSTGILVRGNVDIASMSWSFAHFSAGGCIVSAVIVLAVFPWAMRGITKLRPIPGLEVIAFPFSFGFFLDLARLATVTWVPKMLA
ncbi:MAG: hypothetical protein ACLP5H_33435 [Desulfomonilaceae bacterium]